MSLADLFFGSVGLSDCRMSRKDGCLVYDVSLPGIKKEDIKIKMVDNIIYLEVKDKKYTLDVKKGFENISAKLDLGILTITVSYPVPKEVIIQVE